jgi:hypothetical protein
MELSLYNGKLLQINGKLSVDCCGCGDCPPCCTKLNPNNVPLPTFVDGSWVFTSISYVVVVTGIGENGLVCNGTEITVDIQRNDSLPKDIWIQWHQQWRGINEVPTATEIDSENFAYWEQITTEPSVSLFYDSCFQRDFQEGDIVVSVDGELLTILFEDCPKSEMCCPIESFCLPCCHKFFIELDTYRDNDNVIFYYIRNGDFTVRIKLQIALDTPWYCEEDGGSFITEVKVWGLPGEVYPFTIEYTLEGVKLCSDTGGNCEPTVAPIIGDSDMKCWESVGCLDPCYSGPGRVTIEVKVDGISLGLGRELPISEACNNVCCCCPKYCTNECYFPLSEDVMKTGCEPGSPLNGVETGGPTQIVNYIRKDTVDIPFDCKDGEGNVVGQSSENTFEQIGMSSHRFGCSPCYDEDFNVIKKCPVSTGIFEVAVQLTDGCTAPGVPFGIVVLWLGTPDPGTGLGGWGFGPNWFTIGPVTKIKNDCTGFEGTSTWYDAADGRTHTYLVKFDVIGGESAASSGCINYVDPIGS